MDRTPESSAEDLLDADQTAHEKEVIDAKHGQDTHDDEDDSNGSSLTDDVSALKAKLAKYEKRNRELNYENAKHRNRAKENEKEANEAKKVALETKESLEVLKRSLEQQSVKSKLIEEAVKAGINDFSTFEKLIDRSALKVSNDGEVSGIQEQIKLLKENKSLAALFEAPKSNSTTHGHRAPPVNSDSIFDASKLKGADYHAAKATLLRGIIKR